ncbi:hypothetical protein HKCCE4037_16340 [Rhodobacterales bacterium HKCCE4037]|nr:hypothetical protein [Rhodobacterales bacterium HKCCE4037]
MIGHRRILFGIGRVGAIGLMAFVSIFLVREIFLRNMQPEPIDGPAHPASDFVLCVNRQVRVANRVDPSDFGTLHTARVIDSSSAFGVLIGGRDVRGRWIIVADFRHDPPQVYDIRAVADPSSVALQHGIANFSTTAAFRSCGAEYMGPVPVPPEEWTTWFGDPFFDAYPGWSQLR